MRGLQRNMRKMWVSLYSSKSKVMSGSKWTGEWHVSLANPFPIYASVTNGMSKSSESLFGTDVKRDRVITISYLNTGITENSMIWIDSAPQFDSSGALLVDSNGDATVPPDYRVTGVSESLNYTSIAVSKVSAQ